VEAMYIFLLSTIFLTRATRRLAQLKKYISSDIEAVTVQAQAQANVSAGKLSPVACTDLSIYLYL